MNQVNLKDIVRDAIQSEWPRFAQEHPHLAAVIDQNLMIEHAATSLEQDPEYQQAMREAGAAAELSGALEGVVRSLVQKLIRSLL
jgi:hypothetical protein